MIEETSFRAENALLAFRLISPTWRVALNVRSLKCVIERHGVLYSKHFAAHSKHMRHGQAELAFASKNSRFG